MNSKEEFELIGKKALKNTLQDSLQALKWLRYSPKMANREMKRAERHARAHLFRIIELSEVNMFETKSMD